MEKEEFIPQEIVRLQEIASEAFGLRAVILRALGLLGDDEKLAVSFYPGYVGESGLIGIVAEIDHLQHSASGHLENWKKRCSMSAEDYLYSRELEENEKAVNLAEEALNKIKVVYGACKTKCMKRDLVHTFRHAQEIKTRIEEVYNSSVPGDSKSEAYRILCKISAVCGNINKVLEGSGEIPALLKSICDDWKEVKAYENLLNGVLF